MTVKEIEKAVSEAQRFIDSAECAVKHNVTYGGSSYICYGKRSGALRRASMDLTRSLADMRKP